MRVRKNITALPVSPTLAANQIATDRRQRGQPVLHMGFGQSPFPAHPKLIEELAGAAPANRYARVAGDEELCQAARDYFAGRLGLDGGAYDVVVAPGSKLLIYALQMAIEGDTLIPMPSWVSYEPQAAMLGDRTIWLPAELSDSGYRIDPARLAAVIADARRRGLHPAKLILNSPNNPTGLTLPRESYQPLAEVCEREGIFVISDEIYSLVSFDGVSSSFATAFERGTAVTTGLSKHLSLGGWRVGFGLIPRSVEGLFEAVVAIASETWSGVATPVQRAALTAVSGDPEIEAYIELCTRLHRDVARYAARGIACEQVRCCRPQGAFYLWPDFGPMRAELSGRGIETSVDLADALLERLGVLTLAGTGFGAPPEQLALRLSVCDYDGEEALEVSRGNRPTPPVGRFAPRVASAVESIRSFISGA